MFGIRPGHAGPMSCLGTRPGHAGPLAVAVFASSSYALEHLLLAPPCSCSYVEPPIRLCLEIMGNLIDDDDDTYIQTYIPLVQ